MEEKIICDCGKDMKNMGNINNIIFTSMPEQWDDTYICESCNIKKDIRKYGKRRTIEIEKFNT